MTIRRATEFFLFMKEILLAGLFVALSVTATMPQPISERIQTGPSPFFPVDIAWELDLAQGLTYPPAFDDERLTLPLRDGTLLTLNVRTGQQVWSRQRPVDSAPVSDGEVVVTSFAQQLVGFRATDGRILWSNRLDGLMAAPMVISGGWLIVGLDTGMLVVFRSTDGEKLWERDLAAPISVRPSPSGDRLYVPLVDGRISTLNLNNGATLWEKRLTGIPQQILPLDSLFVGSTDNFFYRLSLIDGEVEWYWRTGGDIIGIPVVDEENVYFSSLENFVWALDRRNGSQRWRQPLDERPTSSPFRIESSVVVPGRSDSIPFFDAETGLPTGQYVAPDELVIPPQYISARANEPHGMLLATGSGLLVTLTKGLGPQQLDPTFPSAPLLPQTEPISLATVSTFHNATLPSGPPLGHARRFTVQVGMFGEKNSADEFAQALVRDGIPAYVLTSPRTNAGRIFRVRVGRRLGYGQAARLKDSLHEGRSLDARLITARSQ